MTRGGGLEPFYSPERVAREATLAEPSPRGELVVVSCRSGTRLARAVVDRYRGLLALERSHHRIDHLADIDFQFSDTESCVRLERHVGGADVFLFQSLLDLASGRSVDENTVAFLLATDACRTWGAAHVTAVLPYLTYARQDKPTRDRREPTSARLMADLALEAGIDRLVTVHPHIAHLPGFYGRVRVDALSPLPYLVDAFQELRGRSDAIVVAPDVGASRLVADAAEALGLPAAIAVKARPRAEEAVTTELIGSFEGRRVALVLDDMIASGGTVRALLRRLAEETEVREVHLGVSHNLGLDIARERLLELQADYGLVDVVVTDSVPQTGAFLELPFLRVVELADVLARTLNRIHHDRPVSSLFREPEAAADRVGPVG